MQNKKQFLRDEKGFSMIEVLVVLTLIAIIAGIGIPAFSQWVPNYQLKQAAYDIFSTMQRAKAEAVRANEPQIIQFTPASGSYQKPDGTTVHLSDFGSTIEFGPGGATDDASNDGGSAFGDSDDGINYSGDRVTFEPRGTADKPGFVYIQNHKDNVYAVGTLISGIIRIRKWTGSDWE